MKRGRAKYYKGKYILALYDNNDDIVGTFDNCHQLAVFFGSTYDAIACCVGRVISGYCSHLIKDNKKYKVYAIEV